MAIVTPVPTPPGTRRRLQLSSPATLERIDEIEVATADDVRAAVERARKAQPAWAALSFDERGAYMRRALEVLLARQEEYMDIVQRETGKARAEALMMEIYTCADSFHYYAKRARKALAPEKRRLHGMMRIAKKLTVVYRPLGVVGVISPWNGPLVLSLNPTIQALMAGNAVIVKPSEVTPRSGAIVADLFREAGLPDGLVQVLLGDGETGAALVESGVDKISFTGSVATGRRVAEACARQLLPCTLELGGKDAMIVCADADLDTAAGGATAGSFMNTGHYCCGTERVYVVESVADEFIRKVVERTKALRQGTEGEFDVGAVFWHKQMDIIEDHMADAIAKGAKVLAGGRRNPSLSGLFYEPTVLVDVTHDMKIMSEETFGPILPIIRVRDEEEALRLANDSMYGLSGNVWSRDTSKGARIAACMDTGSVSVNDMAVTYGIPEAPFGGRKWSGLGQVNGDAGLRGFCFAQPIIVDRFGGKNVSQHYPYTIKKVEDMQKFMRFLWGTRIGRWIA